MRSNDNSGSVGVVLNYPNNMRFSGKCRPHFPEISDKAGQHSCSGTDSTIIKLSHNKAFAPQHLCDLLTADSIFHDASGELVLPYNQGTASVTFVSGKIVQFSG